MNTDYIPARFNDLVVWAQNLYVNFGPIKEQLGVTDGEMATLKKYGDDLDPAARMRNRAEDLWHDTVAYCDLLADGPEEDVALPVLDFFNVTAGTRHGGFKTFIRRLVRKIKAAAYYDIVTSGTGNSIGLNVSNATVNASNVDITTEGSQPVALGLRSQLR